MTAKEGKKKLKRVIYGRTIIFLAFLLINIALLAAGFFFLGRYMRYAYWAYSLLEVVVIVSIMNDKSNPMYKLAWIIPILIVPIFGTLLYLYIHFQLSTRFMNRKLLEERKNSAKFMQQRPQVLERFKEKDPGAGTTAAYMGRTSGFPVYENSQVTYFPSGEEKWEELKRQLRAAKHFIFLEYFIVGFGEMWGSVLEILESKAKEGVEVRMMYDGTCMISLLPADYPQYLEKRGIKCRIFSPLRPAITTYQNNRDHRKIVVIDGHTAFTGGVNLADEYINKKERFGHWKDTAVMVKGDAVRSFTMMFLELWNMTEKYPEDYGIYADPRGEAKMESEGFVIPYGDSPLDEENLGEQVYLDIVYQATRYVHIMTPYLILDHEMMSALTHAAKRGVEVVIIMPHIPDKPYAFWLAKTYYQELLEAGVRIVEYTPGFVHAKSFVSDDKKAVVGTINLDFRSLYLHFECAVYMYGCHAVLDVERDFAETLKKCQEVTVEDCKKLPLWQKAAGKCLRLIAPLM